MRKRASVLPALWLALLVLPELPACGGRTGILVDGAPAANQGGAGAGLAGSPSRAGTGGGPSSLAGAGGAGGSLAMGGESGEGGTAGSAGELNAHFFAYTQFLSSSSTRASAHLLDLNNGAAFTLLDDAVSSLRFSPDGRWLGFCNALGPGSAQVFVVSTASDLPGPNLPLADQGQISNCGGYAWSPDGQKVAYFQRFLGQHQLWVADTSGNIPLNRVQLTDGVAPSAVAWMRNDVLLFQDDQGRPNVSQLRSAPLPPLRTIVDVPGASWISFSPSEPIAFAQRSPDFLLVDTETGAFNVLGTYPTWQVAPSFEFAVGHAPGGQFEVFRLEQTKLGDSVRSSSTTELSAAAFATLRPAFAERINESLEITTVMAAEVRSNHVRGSSGKPLDVRFAEGDESVVFSDASGVWAARWTDALITTARQLVATTTPPAFDLAPDGKRLIVGGGKPYALSFTSLDPKEKPYNVQAELLWSEVAWSADSERVAVIGGSSQLGRVLYLTRIADLGKGPPELVASCNTSGSTPQCPNQVEFQP